MVTEPHKVIFHIDMDAFFASIEQRDNPDLKCKPVIVGALPGNRGVVSAASYEARKYGIHSAMPINQAYSRCPQGVYLKPRMNVYTAVSGEVMTILRSFSPVIEQVSVDEAFMDMSGTRKLLGPPRKAAEMLSKRIREKLNLTASIGIAPNKFLAKLASDMNKPCGITDAPFDAESIIRWLAPLPVSRIWGVGTKTRQALEPLGVTTIADLQGLSAEQLQKRFGKGGIDLYYLCRGIDYRDVDVHDTIKSISREHTFSRDSFDKEEWRRTLLSLSGDVAKQARQEQVAGRTVFITFRTPDFKRYTRQTTLALPTDLAKHLYENALLLLEKESAGLASLRLLGVGITNFDSGIQTELFGGDAETGTWSASEKAMDMITERFGDCAIMRGAEIRGTKKKKPV